LDAERAKLEAQQAQLRANSAEERAEKLAAYLRSLGVNPEEI
jgi:predicted ArsR family transcriptional regulator